MKKYFNLYMILLAFSFFSCTTETENIINSETKDSCNYIYYSYNDIKIKKLLPQDLPYMKKSKKVEKKNIYDSDSLPLHLFDKKLNYHPVFLAQYGLHLYDVYNETKDTIYLSTIKKIIDKLVCSSLKLDSSLLYIYSFDFSLHGVKKNEMKAPWYSAMAQGQILSLLCRTYYASKNKKYLNIARKTFYSFLRIKGENNLSWITCVDKEGNLWLEEYPQDIPNHTLNGMIFGIFGIYEFYNITKDKNAEILLKASISTIKKKIYNYRNKGGISLYCLKHKVQNYNYHKIHINQLKMLYKITGDKYFNEVARDFENDTKDIQK